MSTESLTNTAMIEVVIAFSGKSKKELAEKIGIKEERLQRKINGYEDFKLGELNKISAELNLSKSAIRFLFFNE